MRGDHFYTTDSSGEGASQNGYESEPSQGFVYTNRLPGTIPLYRWYSPLSGDHLYTVFEGDGVKSYGYLPEGVACYVYPASSGKPGHQPLYQWLNSNGDHFYCLSPTGEVAAASGYSEEGPACDVSTSQVLGTLPWFRWFQSSDGKINPAWSVEIPPGHNTEGEVSTRDDGNIVVQMNRTNYPKNYAEPSKGAAMRIVRSGFLLGKEGAFTLEKTVRGSSTIGAAPDIEVTTPWPPNLTLNEAAWQGIYINLELLNVAGGTVKQFYRSLSTGPEVTIYEKPGDAPGPIVKYKFKINLYASDNALAAKPHPE